MINFKLNLNAIRFGIHFILSKDNVVVRQGLIKRFVIYFKRKLKPLQLIRNS